MLLISFRRQPIRGLRPLVGYCAAFMEPAPRNFLNNRMNGNGSGCGRYRSSTGVAMELLSSPSSSPDDNTHRIVGNNNCLNNDLLQSILLKHDVRPNELNERCLLALRGCSVGIADYAVQAYANQQRKREMKKETKISDPSSYILAVLR